MEWRGPSYPLPNASPLGLISVAALRDAAAPGRQEAPYMHCGCTVVWFISDFFLGELRWIEWTGM